jgi:hypothetical protein
VIVVSLAAAGRAPGGDTESRGDHGSHITALAPVVILAEGFHQISGIAVDAAGSVLVTDRAQGTLTRVGASGRSTTLVRHLHDPLGVAVEADGGILVLEQGGGRILRVGGGSTVYPLVSGLKQPRALAIGPDGQIWVAAEGTIGRLEAGRVVPFAAGFVSVRAIAVDRSAVYVAMRRLAHEHGRTRTTLVRVPVTGDGTSGVQEAVLSDQRLRATGVAIDAMGDTFIGAAANSGKTGVILKAGAATRTTVFADGLMGAVAVAFLPGGDLIAAETGSRGRLVRFRAPSAPDVDAVTFTNRIPAVIGGTAEPGHLIQLFAELHETATASTLTDAVTGDFTISVPVAPNGGTDMFVRATAAGGAGLVGPPRSIHVVHDDHIPRVTITEPQLNTYSRGVVPLRATAEDDGSGIKAVRLMLDDAVVAAIDNAEGAGPVVASTSLDAASVAEGSHTITAVASDRAGNSSSMAQLLLVDRTAPETLIVSGPSPETADTAVSFVAEAVDALSPAFTFSWRLDEAAWSLFGPVPTITVSNLAAGPHRFEIRARDTAGNEDATPAVYLFTVIALTIHIIEPAQGAIVTTTSLWVRGTVQSGGREVSVTIPVPAAVRAMTGLDVLPAAVEGGMFAAELPLLVPGGATAIAATADDGQGSKASDTVTVSVGDTFDSPGRLRAFPDAGVAPHTVRFGVSASDDTARYQVDLDSDGIVDFEGPTLVGQDFVYTRPGVYVATVTAITSDGQASVFRTAVQVYDGGLLNERLRAAWRGFKDALGAGDVPVATSFIHSGRRARWADVFRQFTPEMFAAVDTVFSDITVLEVSPNRIECEMIREENGVSYSFPVSFERDADGRWRLWQF